MEARLTSINISFFIPGSPYQTDFFFHYFETALGSWPLIFPTNDSKNELTFRDDLLLHAVCYRFLVFDGEVQSPLTSSILKFS